MRRLVILVAIVGVLVSMLPPAWAATTINTTRSNSYRLTYPADLISKDQADALLADLDKVGRAWTTSGNEAQLKQWLANNFRRFGVVADRVKKVVVLFPTRERAQTYGVTDPTTWIILLTNPADEAAAIAVTIKSTKSNTSD